MTEVTMAEINGLSKHEDTVSVLHLGKRKRTVSPEIENRHASLPKPVLQDVLHLLREYVRDTP
jgi:hypothetical protein